MATPILGGKLADRYSGYVDLTTRVPLRAPFTSLVPLTTSSFFLLLAFLVLLGASEGFAMPAMNTLIAVAFVYSGMYVGSILGLSITPYRIASAGYDVAFICTPSSA